MRDKTWGERLDLTVDTVGAAVVMLSWIAVLLTAVWAVTYCLVNHITVSDFSQTIGRFVDDSQGDEVGFVQAMRAEGYNESANDALDAGHKICGRLRSDGSTPTDVVKWMESNKPAGIDAAILRKMAFTLVTNAQLYLCPDTLHNTGVTPASTPTTAPPARTAPPTMVATTAPPYPTPGWTWPPSDMNAYCRDHPNDWVECGGSRPSTPSSTQTYPTPDPCPYPGAAAHGCAATTREETP